MGVVPLWLGVTPPLRYMVHPLWIVPGYTFAVLAVLPFAVIGKGISPALFTLIQNEQHNQRQRRASQRKNAHKDMSKKFSHFEFILSIF